MAACASPHIQVFPYDLPSLSLCRSNLSRHFLSSLCEWQLWPKNSPWSIFPSLKNSLLEYKDGDHLSQFPLLLPQQQLFQNLTNLDKTAITMSEDSPVHHVPTTDKGVPAHSDVENGDTGVLVHAAPLARKLKGRHMQMIAIGQYFHNEEVHLLNSYLCRWSDWSWFVCWIWKCVGDWWPGKFGACCFPRFYFAETKFIV